MLNDKSIKKLSAAFKIPVDEMRETLEKIGFREDVKNVTSRVTKAEHDDFFKYCQDIDSTMADQIRIKIEEAVQTSKLNKAIIDKVTSKKVSKNNQAYINVKLSKSTHIDFIKLCKKYCISKNKVIRYFAKEIMKGGKK